MTATTKTAEQLRAEQEQDDMLASLLAQSNQALRNYERTIADIDRQSIGEWYGMPPRMQADGWCFYRCGVQKDPFAHATRAVFHQHSWVDAPKGVQMRGLEGIDAQLGGGIYVCCPPENYRRMKDVQDKARTKVGRKEILESLTTDLADLGVALEGRDGDEPEINVTEMSAEDFAEKTKEGSKPRAKRI